MDSKKIVFLAISVVAVVVCFLFISLSNTTKVFAPVSINEEQTVNGLTVTLKTAQVIISNNPTLKLTFQLTNNSLSPVDVSSDAITVFTDDQKQQATEPTAVTIALPNETVDIIKTVNYKQGCSHVIVLYGNTSTPLDSWVIKCNDLEA